MLKELKYIEDEFDVEVRCVGLRANDINKADYFIVEDQTIGREYKVEKLGDIRIKIISERLDYNFNGYIITDGL